MQKQDRLTPKQRVQQTFERNNPDRVPINYTANPGIDAALKMHFGLSKNDDEGLRRKLSVDFRGISPSYTGKVLHAPKKDRKIDPQWGTVTRWVEHATGGYWDFCDFPMAQVDVKMAKQWPMPHPDDYEYGSIRKQCEDHTPFCLYAGGAGLGDCMNSISFWTGYEQAVVGFATGDPAVLCLIDRRHAIQYEVTKRTLEAASGAIDFLWIGEDLGSQDRPLISLDLFRSVIRPRLQMFVDLARKFNIPVMIHSCGSSRWAFEDFIDMGITAVDTLQPEAKGMAPHELVQSFGSRLAYHGCISTAGPVAYGTVMQTEQVCRKTLQTMMPTKGYCFSPTHALQDNSPVQNVVRMYETAHRDGWYV